MPLDFGATWIHGTTGNPLSALADDIEATRLVTRYEHSIAYNASGQELSRTEEARLDELRERVYQALETAQDRDNDTSVRQAVRALQASFGEFSEENRLINFILNSELEQEYSGSIDRLSAHWYDAIKEFGGNDALFAQGFQVISQHLAEGLSIKTGHVVREIDWQQTPIRVVTQYQDFLADQVIVTLPLGVLQAQQVQFTPALPANKQNAIAKLGMGVLNKCYLRFTQAFWPDDVDWLEYVAPEFGAWTEWVSFQRVAGKPVLLGFNSGTRGREIEDWTDQQMVASAMEALRTIFGASIPDPVSYQLTRWGSDPHARGSYSFNALGSTPNMRKVLAAPLGNKLFFAGEASEQNYFGTAHGAYLSGLRAATEVLGVLW
ncbi:MAG: FAD-dependent oxidoreductase [Thiolinea sp.]